MRSLTFSSLLLFLSVEAVAQFKNLDFSEICDSSKTGLCYWDLSWGGKNSVQPARTGSHNTMRIQGRSTASVGFAEQSISIPPSQGIRIITISADLRTDSVQGRGAGLNIGLYDNAGQLVANKDMGGFYSLDWTTGKSDWKKQSISIICPPQVAKVKIGAILYGFGTAWFRQYDARIEGLASKKPNRLAKKYIQAAIDTILTHSLVRDSLDQNKLHATALRIAGRAKSYDDCHLAIGYLLESLREYGDHHSFFMKAEEVRNWETAGSQVSKLQFSEGKIIDSIGYILVPAFHGGNPTQILAFADSLQRIIGGLFRSGIKGWIVDLTQNTGGNMAPMIAGLGPLFSDETLGYLVDVNKQKNAWHYKAGQYFWDDDTGLHVSAPVVLPLRLPIAVLTSSQTGSSGEAVAISFIRNANTRSFGKPTWGLTTGNGSFRMKDGSQMYLASTIMADRHGDLYRHGIQPDQLIDGKQEDLLKAATEWIGQQKILPAF
jgi:carboxyl-terminal processing protease